MNHHPYLPFRIADILRRQTTPIPAWKILQLIGGPYRPATTQQLEAHLHELALDWPITIHKPADTTRLLYGWDPQPERWQQIAPTWPRLRTLTHNLHRIGATQQLIDLTADISAILGHARPPTHNTKAMQATKTRPKPTPTDAHRPENARNR